MQPTFAQIMAATWALARNGSVVIGVLGLVALLGVAHLFKGDAPSGKWGDTVAVKRDLEEEYAAIALMPGSVRTRYDSIARDRDASVGATYRINANYRGLRVHYDPELARSGWQFCGEEKLRDWGRDLGGMSAYYRKGEYRASLQYAGERASYGWTYALTVSWGGRDDCGAN